MPIIDDTEPRSGPRDTSWPPMRPVEVAIVSKTADEIPNSTFVHLREFDANILFRRKHPANQRILILDRSKVFVR